MTLEERNDKLEKQVESEKFVKRVAIFAAVVLGIKVIKQALIGQVAGCVIRGQAEVIEDQQREITKLKGNNGPKRS